jgi:hypothetical protein
LFRPGLGNVRLVRAADLGHSCAMAPPDPSFDPDRPIVAAERAAWERFVAALERLTELQSIHALGADDITTEDLVAGEVELEDAIAVAGEFEVKKIRWILT